jgi:riboflavin kinase
LKENKVLWRNPSVILKLIELGAWKNWVYVTTTELASDIGLPQQTVSRVLNELSSSNFIEKKRVGRTIAVRLTEKCLNSLRFTYERLTPIFEELKTFRFSGIVLSGFGDGEHYVKIYMDKFEEVLKFKPYPGTLNLKIIDLNDLKTLFIIRGLPRFKDREIY